MLPLFPAPATIAALHVFGVAAGLYALGTQLAGVGQGPTASPSLVLASCWPAACVAVQVWAVVAALERGSTLFVASWLCLGGKAVAHCLSRRGKRGATSRMHDTALCVAVLMLGACVRAKCRTFRTANVAVHGGSGPVARLR